MYTVWAAGEAQSEPFETLEAAKEFAHESNMFAFVIDDTTCRNVWDVSECKHSPFYKGSAG
jgi:hypothetical protein